MIDGWWFLRQPGGSTTNLDENDEVHKVSSRISHESFSLLAYCRGISDDQVEVVGDQTETISMKAVHIMYDLFVSFLPLG